MKMPNFRMRPFELLSETSKGFVRAGVLRRHAVDYSELLTVIKDNRFEVISFDVFDTLVLRDVREPTDVFRLLGREFGQQFDSDAPFFELRVEAERRARELTTFDEVTLREIYDALPLPESQRRWALDREIELELALCTANRGIKRVWKALKEEGRRLAITSDTYLPSHIVEEILRTCGYDGWEKLTVSSETRSRKSDGKAFLHLIDEIGVRAESILHIGDSPRSDWLAPKHLGMHAVLVEKKTESFFYNERLRKWADDWAVLEHSVISAFVANHMSEEYDYFGRVGYETIGPILFGYAKWLEESAKEDGVSKVFFLTREGATLRRAYQTYAGDMRALNDDLLNVSRRATSVPLLAGCDSLKEAVRVSKVPRSGAEVGRVLELWRIPRESIETALKALGIGWSDNIREIDEASAELLFKMLRESIRLASKEQREAISAYLDGKGFTGRVAVSDVGWFGTIQSNLQSIRPDNEIVGYYLAKKQTYGGIARPKEERFFLYDSMYSPVGEKLTSAVEVFEECFLASSGTTTGYRFDEHGVAMPMLAEPERDSEATIKMNTLQGAAMQFIEDFRNLAVSLDLKLPADACSAAYCKFIDPPSSEMINEFGKLATTDTGRNATAPFVTGSLRHYILHPRDFIRDFRGPGSKGVFLSSTFKLPLPWPRILSLLRRIERQEG